MKRQTWITALGVALALGATGVALGQAAKERPAARNMTQMKFQPIPELPTCLQGSVQQGDPAATPFTLLAKVKSGCTVPWHWHSAAENVMIVSGAAELSMKGDSKPTMLRAAGFARMPAKHIHQMVCNQSCTFFIHSEGKFDIHYVDRQGKEITADQALKPLKEIVARR